MWDAGWFTILSLLFGLTALSIPAAFLLIGKKQNKQRWSVLSGISLSSCAIAVGCQLFYNHHLVIIEDWAALLDTTSAAAYVSAVLILITISLNIIVWAVLRTRLG